jgi:N-acyl-D-amino-acid deacylase
MRYVILLLVLLVILAFAYRPAKTQYDCIIRYGTIYDGSGKLPYHGDIAIHHDTVAAIGDLSDAVGKKEIDARGLAIAPGFINMLSWADQSLLMDGRSMSDIKQGVTLEVFGEGFSPGPVKRRSNIKADSLWTALGGYFQWAMKKGVSPNIASFVGATTIRMHELDQANRPPTRQELERMKILVHKAMEDGAMGLGASLIYAPATFASTEELIELCKVAASYGGLYTTHMRSEGDFILDALDETFRIAKEANIATEIYHLKINIERNWNKIDSVIAKIDSARNAGLKITANLYPYVASGTGLTSRMPTWVQEGGAKEMRKRLKKKSVYDKVLYEMAQGIPYKNSDPSAVIITSFRLDSLNKLYKGKRLSEIAKLHGKTADETVIDLVIKDKSRIEALYYLQSEENIKKIIKLPYVSIGSDAGSLSESKIFEDWGAHPRAYGTFAKVFRKYVRDEKILTMEEAVRRMTSLPAANLKIVKRGRLVPGYYADLVVFEPEVFSDRATFDDPHQYAVGMQHVFVNGTQVLASGEHTNARPGRVIYGPGWKRP